MQVEPGRYDEEVLEGLDFLLHEMGIRGMRAVVSTLPSRALSLLAHPPFSRILPSLPRRCA